MSTTAPAPELTAPAPADAPAPPADAALPAPTLAPPAEAAPPVPAPVAAPPARPADPDVTVFRGRTLEELLPQIREQLGPDAIVMRQRDGLMGGIGGFFQQRFVEVEAKAGHPRVDVYDEQPPDTPESFAAVLAEAESEADPIVTAAAFAPPVGESAPPAPPEPTADKGGPRFDSRSAGADSHSSPDPAPLAAQQTVAAQLAAELRRAGMSHTFAERLLQDAEAHELPFAQGDLRQATRRALARRIPTAMPYRAGDLAIAFAGPGSTSCAAALATAYGAAGRDAHAVATLDQARVRLERGNPDQLLALDLPPIASEHGEVAALAERLRAVELDELLMVLPADADLSAARALRERLAPLAPTGLALVCADARPAAPPGAALELACTTRLPVAFVLEETHGAGGAIAPADPAALAEQVLP